MPGDTIGVCGVWILFWSFGCQSEVQPFKMSYLASLDSDAEEEFIGCVRIRTRMAIMFEQRVRELCDPLIQGAKE